jgi:glycosyltransferase involved in cell wall biosynthesis
MIMKIALVHDYLSQDGGAEKVLEAFHEIWPEAPIFVLFHDKKAIRRFHSADVRESWLARVPLGRKRYQWLLPLMPLATESYRLDDYDVVLSSVSAFAKGVITSPQTIHISYCHTPTRYLWSDTHSYLEDLQVPRFIKLLLPPVLDRLRNWDRRASDRVDRYIANSDIVRGRIEKYYERESDVIFPPVDTELFRISPNIGDYFVTGGRLVPYKRIDMVVHVFNRLGYPLKVFGDGSELKSLRREARGNIQFLGRISDEDKATLLSEARAFIHPQVEDLGITPIESMASGRPVIAYDRGGVRETVVAGKTGVFFADQTWESLLDAVLHFDEYVWDPVEIRIHAEQFSQHSFERNIHDYVDRAYRDSQDI